MSLRRALPALLMLTLLPARARAAEDDERFRDAMPEPILVESTTDLDSDEPGELEVDFLSGAALRAPREGPSGQVELEWRATARWGFSAELEAGALWATDISGRLSVAYALFHDVAHDAHVQLVAHGRWPFVSNAAGTLEVAEPALPLSVGAHGGMRRGLLTARGELDLEAGARAAHVPLRGALTLLVANRLLYAGVDAFAELARQEPWAFAAEAGIDGALAEIPMRFGLALPWAPASGALGLTARLVVALE